MGTIVNLAQNQDEAKSTIVLEIPMMLLDHVVDGSENEFGVVVTMGTKQELVWVGIYTINATAASSLAVS